MKRVVVVGGGPAGMMAAIAAKQHYADALVMLIEKNASLGVKLRLTGGGRCNLTADVSHQEIIKNTARNSKFLYSTLNQFDAQAIQRFFIKRGCELKVEDHHRVFPLSNKSSGVVDVLETELKKLGVLLRFNLAVTSIDAQAKQVVIGNERVDFDRLIVATGGVSYPSTGSDFTSFEMITALGQPIAPLKPAEVPLVSNDGLIQSKMLQGLSFRDVNLSVVVDEKNIFTIKHDVLFTHFGLSGPAALAASSYLRDAFDLNQSVKIKLDFLPDVSLDEIQHQVTTHGFTSLAKTYTIPKRLLSVISQNHTEDASIRQLKQFSLHICGTRGFLSAFVTSGGVVTSTIDPKTLRSRVYPWLSFCGEVLDVHGSTGGYNMTIAFSTGYSAGMHALDEGKE